MIVSLKQGADPKAVMGELVVWGLWVTQGTGRTPAWMCGPYSVESHVRESAAGLAAMLGGLR